MNLLVIILFSAAALLVAYRIYGRYLVHFLRLDAHAATPAVTMRDDLDFHPIGRGQLLNQHFSAIAAAGPIVGPILAGVMFGWVPALVWIVVGSIFIGGVHDLTALTASIRHQARSIAEVVRQHMTRRSYLFFLIFVWLALDYIIVAFTDLTAASFVGEISLDNGEKVFGAGIATSSLLYLLLPVAMGFLIRFGRVSPAVATMIFLPLVGVSIWIGQLAPFSLERFGLSAIEAQKTWALFILGYCFIASMLPLWSLLQPRGHLGGYFLLFILTGGALGLILGRDAVAYPSFRGWINPEGAALFPILFITIACGACSGFHAIIASGTTSKQLARETDAKPIAYGGMLLEGMVAVVSLACVMRLAPDSPLIARPGGPQPNFLYAQGIGSFLSTLGIPAAVGVSFALMAFTTFVYDTLDVCTRLGRYILQELFNWRGTRGKLAAAIITAAAPVPFLLMRTTDAKGNLIPAWKVFWELFGASNQLLAALTLIGVTVWLWRTRRTKLVFVITGLPTVLMYTMSVWALVRMIRIQLAKETGLANPVPWVAAVLIGLAVMVGFDAIRVLLKTGAPPSSQPLEPAFS